MALADPLGHAAFTDLFRVDRVRFALQWQQEGSLAGAGERLYSDRAPALWMAELTTVPLLKSESLRITALINSRQGGLKTVLLHDPDICVPTSDPGGTLFGSSTPVVGTITDRLHVAFSGFPVNYVIPAGTYFQVIFDTSRYYLGQFAEAATANGSGAVATVEITPALPASVDPGDAVTVIKPSAKFRIVPNSAYPSRDGGARSRIQFAAEQTYAA